MTMALDDLNGIISRINDVSPSNREAWLAALGSAIRERDELQQKLRLAYKDLSDGSQLIHAADRLREKAEVELAALRKRIADAPVRLVERDVQSVTGAGVHDVHSKQLYTRVHLLADDA